MTAQIISLAKAAEKLRREDEKRGAYIATRGREMLMSGVTLRGKPDKPAS